MVYLVLLQHFMRKRRPTPQSPHHHSPFAERSPLRGSGSIARVSRHEMLQKVLEVQKPDQRNRRTFAGQILAQAATIRPTLGREREFVPPREEPLGWPKRGWRRLPGRSTGALIRFRRVSIKILYLPHEQRLFYFIFSPLATASCSSWAAWQRPAKTTKTSSRCRKVNLIVNNNTDTFSTHLEFKFVETCHTRGSLYSTCLFWPCCCCCTVWSIECLSPAAEEPGPFGEFFLHLILSRRVHREGKKFTLDEADKDPEDDVDDTIYAFLVRVEWIYWTRRNQFQADREWKESLQKCASNGKQSGMKKMWHVEMIELTLQSVALRSLAYFCPWVVAKWAKKIQFSFAREKIHLNYHLALRLGRQMCALCPADAKRKSLGDRCQGHGVDSKLTRWRSTVKPRCHGKWRRIYEVGNCPCKAGPDFIFV